MNLPKLLLIVSLLLFGVIGVAALFKKEATPSEGATSLQVPVEIELDEQIQTLLPAAVVHPTVSISQESPRHSARLPEADRVDELFNTEGPNLPIVETITYKSHVPWQKGRPAWLSDYASHYHTSRHFIARSLNGKPEYFKQDLAEGHRFNVLRNDKNFKFHLVVDTSRCKMWLYYLDEGEKVLIKTYQVGLGRLDASKVSGLLTPLGTYMLGDRVAIFKPKTTGMRQGKKVEFITVFGTRWIPFDKEIENYTLPAKGFGIHGTPWVTDSQGVLVDSKEGLGTYKSDGCIRLATFDIEELFAIIISRPATIEIVRDFSESSVAK